ncbi:interferon gamma 1 [Megalops cyprinoides]|uniref:interferon gamma 1 n=1 Tax=Megalops cyprinoides TaxID=118141 RepID=UPI0018652207|nr:interferon gamma 1 [Megalops cyprinoides]
MCSLRNLALLFGLCLLIGWANSNNDFIPERTKADIMKLKVHFVSMNPVTVVYQKTSDKALFGHPLFPNLGNFEECEQRFLLHEILEVYDRILSNMLNRTQDRDIRTSLHEVRHRVDELRRNYFNNKEHLLKERLQELWALKMDDLVVQRKAIKELMSVYQEAAQLGSRIRGKKERRRRRNAQRKRVTWP